MGCINCGKLIKKSTNYCNDNCELTYNNFISNNSNLVFSNYVEASKFFKKDKRTVKKFENLLFTIDKNIKPNIQIKWVTCKICNNKSKSSECRRGYCKLCSKLGYGKKNQGIIISKKYKGIGNPNYLHGESISTDYNDNKWYKLKKELNFTKCEISGLQNNIDYHHIIPRWFCKIVEINVYDSNNIIGLNHEYHKVIHHLQLDILLLPTLYSLYKKDALQLRKEFLNLLQLHKVHQFPVDQLQSQDLFQVSRYLGKKKLLDLLPEFLKPFLNQME
jgi:hypothetical protein